MGRDRSAFENGTEIAVIGLAGRFPGASSIERLWNLLRDGQDGLSRFSFEELAESGVPADVAGAADYVPVSGIVEGFDLFDAEFFGVAPAETAVMDPQQRLVLETSWRALEDAGYARPDLAGRIGVFAGVGVNSYLLNVVAPSLDGVLGQGKHLGLLFASEKDFVATRVAYRLGLSGPAMAIQTACSSGLVAVHQACRALQADDCDMAIVTAASIRVPHAAGYLFQDGSIFSRTGRCRAFDTKADGCVPGNGVVAVVLKRLADAERDADHVEAVVLSTAVNNDGNRKVGFGAPSVQGQAEVIRAAQALAEVSPEEIGFIEAHGTGTRLGDSIEIAALTEAFAGSRTPCGIGSIKTNIGHLDAAAGLAGFVKAALSLRHRIVPPSLHFSEPSPDLDLDRTPFNVVREPSPWPIDGPRVAAVSSFGVGGTNAHAILMEARPAPQRAQRREPQCLRMSAARPEALRRTAAELKMHLMSRPSLDMRDVAFTLRQGRPDLACRAVVIARTAEEAIARLDELASDRTGERVLAADDAPPDTSIECVRWVTGETSREALPQRDNNGARRVSLPGVSFDPRRHWLDVVPGSPRRSTRRSDHLPSVPEQAPEMDTDRTGFRLDSHVWSCRPLPLGKAATSAAAGQQWVVIHDGHPFMRKLSEQLAATCDCEEILAASQPPGDLAARLQALRTRGTRLRIVIAAFAAGCRARQTTDISVAAFEAERASAFDLPLAVGRALATGEAGGPVHIDFLTLRRFNVLGDENVDPVQWLVEGPARVLPQEIANLTTRTIDLPADVEGAPASDEIAGKVAAELQTEGGATLAIRNGAVWRRSLEPVPIVPRQADSERDAFTAGTFLVTGGFGGIGRNIARDIARSAGGARIALVGRRLNATARRQPWNVAASELDALVKHHIERDSIELIGNAPELVRDLHILCAARIAGYWRSLGFTTLKGCEISEAEILHRSRVLPALTRMLRFQIGVMMEDNFIAPRNGHLVWLRDAPEDRDGDSAAQSIRAADPRLDGLLNLLEHCVDNYGSALSGDIEPISVLYPGGRDELMKPAAESMLERSTGAACCRALADWAAQLAAAASPRQFRILEIGAGNGLLTRELTAALLRAGAAKFEVVVTDIGRNFVVARQAEATDAGWANMTFRTFDATLDPVAQGFETGTFDLVCGLNVVHATPNVAETLANLRALLAPGAGLALVESVCSERWVDMVAGLSGGWWSFTDHRTTSPLMGIAGWRDVFANGGFSEFVAFPGSDVLSHADCALLAAVAPSQGDHQLLTPSEQEYVAALRRDGAEVMVVRADLRDARSVSAAIDEVRAGFGPVTALIHTAGRIAGALARNLSPAEIDAEFGARVHGLIAVMAALERDPLELVILSSSLNVLHGGEGQTAYVAANAVLSGLACALRERAARVHVVHWDRWRGTGLGTVFENRYRRLKGGEIKGGLDPESALRGLRLSLRLGLQDVAVSGDEAPTATHSIRAPAKLPALQISGKAATDPISGVNEETFRTALLHFCRTRLSRPQLSADDRLLDIGIDSLEVLELQDALEQNFGIKVFSAALMSEPLGRLAAACNDPARASTTLEIVALEKFSAALTQNPARL